MIFALIPLKRLSEAKSRLGPDISSARRAAMMTDMVSGVTAALRASSVIDRIALVTPEEALAHRLGVESLADRGSLNASLRAGVEWALRDAAEQLLIVPADLPAISAEDVRALAANSPDAAGICIAATTDGGTGALLLRPPDAIAPAFGAHSFHRHMRLAEAAGLPVTVVQRHGLSLDLDTLDDLRAYSRTNF